MSIIIFLKISSFKIKIDENKDLNINRNSKFQVEKIKYKEEKNENNFSINNFCINEKQDRQIYDRIRLNRDK